MPMNRLSTRRVACCALAIFALAASAFGYQHPRLGRFVSRDPGPGPVAGVASSLAPAGPYAAGMNLYQYAGSNPAIRVDPRGREDYRIGTGPKPTINWDNGFAYDPTVSATAADYANWAYYGTLLAGAQALGHLPDGTRAYAHYRDATGTDLSVDYNKAIRDDSLITNGFDAELAGAQADIEREHDGAAENFTVYSTKARQVDSGTENWQKALGGHRIWGTGSVKYDPKTCEYTLEITVNAEDFYNFNKGQADIATGLPDDANGRFEVLGWAKSFFSRGEVMRTVTWKRGQADDTTQIDGAPRGGRRRR